MKQTPSVNVRDKCWMNNYIILTFSFEQYLNILFFMPRVLFALGAAELTRSAYLPSALTKIPKSLTISVVASVVL